MTGSLLSLLCDHSVLQTTMGYNCDVFVTDITFHALLPVLKAITSTQVPTGTCKEEQGQLNDLLEDYVLDSVWSCV